MWNKGVSLSVAPRSGVPAGAFRDWRDLGNGVSSTILTLMLGAVTPAHAINGTVAQALNIEPDPTAPDFRLYCDMDPVVLPDGTVKPACHQYSTTPSGSFVDNGLYTIVSAANDDFRVIIGGGQVLEPGVTVSATTFGELLVANQGPLVDGQGMALATPPPSTAVFCETFVTTAGVRHCVRIDRDGGASAGLAQCGALNVVSASPTECANEELRVGDFLDDPDPNVDWWLTVPDASLVSEPGSKTVKICPGSGWTCVPNPQDPLGPGFIFQGQQRETIVYTPGTYSSGGKTTTCCTRR